MSDGDRDLTEGRQPTSPPFGVGEWVADPAWSRIRRNGDAVRLEPRVMRLLERLAATPGRPVMRQELLDSVWPDVLVNEEALSRAVSQLRRALGDDPRAPRYIQTLHKGGYCLIAPVNPAPAEQSVRPHPKPERPGLVAMWPFLLLILAGIAAAALYRAFSPAPPVSVPRALVPLTSETGREIDPAVSMDGTRVAYLASTPDGYELFVRNIDGGPPSRITRSALAKGHPAWSPDGSRIAFVGAAGDAAAIYLQAVKGGEPAKLIDLPSWSYGLDWSPDGRTLAYSDAAPGESPAIALLDIPTRAVRPIAHSASSHGDVKPVFSPDARRLAFVRTGPLGRQQIAVVDLRRGGDAAILAASPQQLRGIDWAPGGDALIFSARLGRRIALWRMAADGDAAPEPLSTEGGDLLNPSVSRDGRIVVEEVEQDSDIWRTALAGGGAEPLIRSTSDDYEPAYSPDGKQLAFVSQRSGAPELWITAPDGEARRITRFAGPDIRQISWSADGARLAFVTEDDAGSAIHVVSSAGGEPGRLSGSRPGDLPIGWSADGKTLMILAPAAGQWRLEELSISAGTRRGIAAPAVRLAALTADGQTIFALDGGGNKLLRLLPGKGIVRQFRLPPSLTSPVALLPTADAVYIVDDKLGDSRVYRIHLESGMVAAGIPLEDYGGGGLSLLHRDGVLAYARARETGNDLAWTRL